MLSVAQINMKSALLRVGLEGSRSPRDTWGSMCLPDQVPPLCSPTDRNPLIYTWTPFQGKETVTAPSRQEKGLFNVP